MRNRSICFFLQILSQDSFSLSAPSLPFFRSHTHSRVFESRLTISVFNPFSLPSKQLLLQNLHLPTKLTVTIFHWNKYCCWNVKGGCPHKSCMSVFSSINFTFSWNRQFFTLIQLFHININCPLHLDFTIVHRFHISTKCTE